MKTNWGTKKLGELLEKTESVNPLLNPETDFFYIDVSGVSRETSSIENATKLKGRDAPSRARKKIKTGDIIFATVRPTLKRIAIVSKKYDEQVCSTGYFVFRPKQALDSQFLFYFLQSDAFDGRMENLQRGASYPAVTDADIKNEYITFPESITEQKRIVRKLDDVFAVLAEVRKKAERNLRSAKELFESYIRNNIFEQKYEIKTLGDVCKGVEYGSSTKSETSGKVAVLRMGNVQNGRFHWDKLVYSNNTEENKKYLLKYNDVLFNRTNSPELVGKTAIYKDESPAIFAGYLIRIHRKEELLDADYLNYYLNSKPAMTYGRSVTISSVNQANINGTKLKTYPIPLPTLLEQKNIVQKLDTLSAHTKELEAVFRRKIADVDELKKSVLQKAFAGEL